MSNTPARTGYAPANGLQMYYEIHGTGQPLVLLHGAFSAIGTSFGKLLPGLAQTRQVIAFELQAHGRTPDIDRPLSLEQMADDVATAMGIERADIFSCDGRGPRRFAAFDDSKVPRRAHPGGPVIGRGGTVESYPEDAEGRSVSGSFLYNRTVSMFERHGFRRARRLGKNHWVVTKVVRGPSKKRPNRQLSMREEETP